MYFLLKFFRKCGLLFHKEINLEVENMIAGDLSGKKWYLNIHPKMKEAFDFLEDCFVRGTKPGRYELDGDNLYALVFQYVPQEKEAPRYETHDRYLDIQCMAAGSEFQWYCPRKDLSSPIACSPEKDVSFYSFAGQGSRLHMKAGDFAIYFPEDGHLPGMADGTTDECMRIVVKIKC